MVHPKRNDAMPADAPPVPQAASGYRPGGQVGGMQAELARRLAQEGILRETAAVLLDEGFGERVVRFVSVTGGGLALAAAYAGVVLLILR